MATGRGALLRAEDLNVDHGGHGAVPGPEIKVGDLTDEQLLHLAAEAEAEMRRRVAFAEPAVGVA